MSRTVNDQLEISADHGIKLSFAARAQELLMNHQMIVVNIGEETAYAEGSPPSALRPFSSRHYQRGSRLTGNNLLLVDLDVIPKKMSCVKQLGWKEFKLDPATNGYGELWKSPRIKIGTIPIDLDIITMPQKGNLGPRLFTVYANFWFASAGSHCGIHDKHDFLEIHTQLYGVGIMQKFRSQKYNSIIEQDILAPGTTTSEPFCSEIAEGEFSYPFHQYFAETDCVWMALEYFLI
ncbi:hypothetical protein HKD31_12295 [Gluconobacter sp. R71646]|uniref:Uncharacterized protein n=1 Tax=Gluconobacter potus TaxID=2724927 RepID=A0ABR9YP02_9PROT|nr:MULTISPECIES: hypothetical protein [Gluconobacter]MBF0865380.1 hypothetical protein [Gluconobacter sp. R71656]MBF0868856.1 hypothetical protein [Gluconobacter sp. R75628]MBF0874869.1 hypothetical protein [Gluconobacter sp. R75629]MBF0883516.1 hypothetical protein [Gluconobacter potus]GFE97887.1 hypothetical protein DmGdi_29600 [Gluconobacter sp. Gdi]